MNKQLFQRVQRIKETIDRVTCWKNIAGVSWRVFSVKWWGKATLKKWSLSWESARHEKIWEEELQVIMERAYIFEGLWRDHCGWTGGGRGIDWVKRSGLREASPFVGPQLRKVSKFIIPIILFTRFWFPLFVFFEGQKLEKSDPLMLIL